MSPRKHEPVVTEITELAEGEAVKAPKAYGGENSPAPVSVLHTIARGAGTTLTNIENCQANLKASYPDGYDDKDISECVQRWIANGWAQ